jgi:hypothetical protein
LERDNPSLKLSVDAISDSPKESYGRLHKAKGRFGALLPQRLPTLVPCLDLDYFDPKVNPLLVWLLGYISTPPP